METIALEIIPEEVALVSKESGLSAESTQSLASDFSQHFTKARGIIEQSRRIVVTDAADKLNVKLARECRLELRSIRIASDKLRKSLKEDSLRRGKAIDGFHNILLHLVEPEEQRLEEQEKFAERQEAERKAEIKRKREGALSLYNVDTTFYALAEMSPEAFAQLLENSRLAHGARLAAAKKAEEDRIAREKAEAEERERVRLENERLKREAFEAAKREEEERKKRAEVEKKALEERRAAEEAARKERLALEEKARKEREAIEAKARAEREAAELAAKKEREAREKIEVELRAREEAERQRVEEEKREAKRAAMAPDSEKIASIAAKVRAIELPQVSTTEAWAVMSLIRAQTDKFAAWLDKLAAELKEGKQ